jgi:hypothetical protein
MRLLEHMRGEAIDAGEKRMLMNVMILFRLDYVIRVTKSRR